MCQLLTEVCSEVHIRSVVPVSLTCIRPHLARPFVVPMCSLFLQSYSRTMGSTSGASSTIISTA